MLLKKHKINSSNLSTIKSRRSKILSLKTYEYEGWFSHDEVEDEDKKAADISPISQLKSDEEGVKEKQKSKY